MSDAEVHTFLESARTVICATNGLDGWPHLMPLWFTLRGEELWAWTFGRSQKVKNLERDPRATLQMESGDSYEELRGVMLECEVVIHRDIDDVFPLALELLGRYDDGHAMPHEAQAMARRQAEKRVALQFVERRRRSFDHRKLNGAY